MGWASEGGRGILEPLDFEIFLFILAKKFVFLFSRGQNEISPLWAPLDNFFWLHLEKSTPCFLLQKILLTPMKSGVSLKSKHPQLLTFVLHHGRNKPNVNMAVIGPKRLPDIINPSCMIVAEMYWMANAYAIVRIPNPATGKELHRSVQVYFVVWRKNTNAAVTMQRITCLVHAIGLLHVNSYTIARSSEIVPHFMEVKYAVCHLRGCKFEILLLHCKWSLGQEVKVTHNASLHSLNKKWFMKIMQILLK